ncbi:MAG: hypothetical protein R2822_28520 [Spirosomataceae bacterium]
MNHNAILTEQNSIEITNKEAIEYPEYISKFLVEQGLPPQQVYLFTEDLEMYFLRTIKHN